MQNDIVKKAEEFVNTLFREKLTPKLIYHNFAHTADTVKIARKIGKKSGLNDEEMEVLTLGAWFHDAGYVEIYKGHEEISINMAKKFLAENNYPGYKIQKVI